MIEIFKDTGATHDLVYHSKINTFVGMWNLTLFYQTVRN